MTKTVKNASTPETGVVAAPANAVEQASNGVGYTNVVKKLMASGCKRINTVRVKNVNWTEKDNYTMISLSLGSAIAGYVSKDDGATFELGHTQTMFTSLFAIAGSLKEDEDLGWMANALLQHPQALNLILNGGTVDILQQSVDAGTEFVNPFSTKEDAAPQVYDHNIVINHIIGFKLGKTGQVMSNKLADKLLGF